MGLDVGGKCGMFFLIIINLIFFLLGVAMLVLGVLFKLDTDIVNTDEVSSVLNEVEFNGSIQLGTISQSFPIALMVGGGVVILLAGMGMFGACCKNRCMLVTYGIIVMIIFLLKVALVVLFFIMRSQVEDEIAGQMRTSFNNQYEGVDSTKELSKGWDLMFIGFDCCGVDSVVSDNQEFSNTVWWANRANNLDLVPFSCCNNATEDNYKTTTEPSCQQSLNSVRNKGCYTAIKDYLADQIPVIAVAIALLVIELIAFIFAFVLCCSIRRVHEDAELKGEKL